MAKIDKIRSTEKATKKISNTTKEAITNTILKNEQSTTIDALGTIHSDEKVIEAEMTDILIEDSEENDDESYSENAFAEALPIKLEDLGLGLEGRPRQASVDRIVFRVLKTDKGFICVNSGMRTFGYRKNLRNQYQKQLLYYEVTERIKLFVQSFLNGFYEFEEVTPGVLRNTVTSRELGAEYRSLLTKNYIKFWNGELWGLNVLTSKGRPNKEKQTMAFLRFSLGTEPDLKEKLKIVAIRGFDENNMLRKTKRVEQFLEKIPRLIKNHFVDVSLSTEDLRKELNKSKEFKTLVARLRGNIDG